jgi:Fe-S-cluster-containing hydrogenase component 2
MEPPRFEKEVAMPHFVAVDYTPCTGCKACEVVCSLYHFGECNPERSAIHVIRKERDGLVLCLPLVCQQCEPAPCFDACPTQALSKDGGGGILTIDEAKCSACGDCAQACPAGCIFMDGARMVAICCDLCGGQPQCIPACHAQCLTKVDRGEASQKQDAESLATVLEQEGLWGHVPTKGVR